MISGDFNYINNLMNAFMKYSFFITILFLAVLLIILLFTWKLGLKIKSENLMQKGMKSSITIFIVIFTMILIVIAISYVRR